MPNRDLKYAFNYFLTADPERLSSKAALAFLVVGGFLLNFGCGLSNFIAFHYLPGIGNAVCLLDSLIPDSFSAFPNLLTSVVPCAARGIK